MLLVLQFVAWSFSHAQTCLALSPSAFGAQTPLIHPLILHPSLAQGGGKERSNQGGLFATFCEKIADPLKRNPSLRGGPINCPQKGCNKKTLARMTWEAKGCFGSSFAFKMSAQTCLKLENPCQQPPRADQKAQPGCLFWVSLEDINLVWAPSIASCQGMVFG